MTNIDLQTEPNSNLIQDAPDSSESQNDFSPEAIADGEAEDAYVVESDESNSEEEVSDRAKSYEVPRPALTIEEASSILGKSIRALERSIAGKWGNKLPEGWHARKMKIDGESEWRIIPPPGFRIKHSPSSSNTDTTDNTDAVEKFEEAQSVDIEDACTTSEEEGKVEHPQEFKNSLKMPGFGFSFENFLNTASKKAKTEIARVAVGQNEQFDEHPTIVIDRSDDVERLLRELADTQKELAEERRMHMEDMRLIAQLQGNMRLLEDHASQTSIMKEELIEAKNQLSKHKEQYEQYLNLPWWKKLFKKAP